MKTNNDQVKPLVAFDIEYQFEQYMNERPQYFDDDGNYFGGISTSSIRMKEWDKIIREQNEYYQNISKKLTQKITVSREIMKEVYLAMEKLGAKSDLLSVIGSFEDSETAEETLESLRLLNQSALSAQSEEIERLRSERKWIDVKTEMPKDDKTKWVTDGTIVSRAYYLKDLFINKMTWAFKSDSPVVGNPTHWMDFTAPLPPSPEQSQLEQSTKPTTNK